MAFPADGCTEKTLNAAAEIYRGTAPVLTYDASWVCVTRTKAKVEKDTRDRQAGRVPTSNEPKLDASAGPSSQLPEDQTDAAKRAKLEEQAVRADDEILMRQKLEKPFVISTDRATFGIALAGGGSKAAAFGSGVLSGLADRDLLDSAAYISSVSGGGYAAYFYYAHKILPALRYGESAPASQALFHDCVRYPARKDKDSGELPRATQAVLAKIAAAGGCSVEELFPDRHSEQAAQAYKYQAFVRCQQDVLNPGECSIERTTGDSGIPFLSYVTTILSMPPSWVATTIFDWGLVTSPAAVNYRNGIGMTYGATATRLDRLRRLGEPGKKSLWGYGPYLEPRTIRVACPPDVDAYAVGCRPGPQYALPEPLTFDELRRGLLDARASNRPLPFWIINAVATESRSTLGWWTVAGKNNTTSSDIFEMTPVSHGSGRYGHISAPMSLHGFTTLDSVGAAAAFLDPNQNVLGGRYLRGPIGVAQRFFNLDWGIDISNYNVNDGRRTLHTAMPFPVFDSPVSQYILHRGQPDEDRARVGSVFIRLIDGGNGENLGLYSLLKRGTRNIMVADAAQDSSGNFGDVCEVRRRLSYAPDGTPKHLYVPGLINLDDHCKNYEKDGLGYGVHHWPFEFPVLLGCVRKDRAGDGRSACADLGVGDSRLFIVKPAIDMTSFRRNQLENFRPPSGPDLNRITACTLPAGRHDGPEPLNCESASFVLLNWRSEDGHCQIFPQHSTVLATANSSHTIYAAYRELARQYTARAGTLLGELANENDVSAAAKFQQLVARQFDQGLRSRPNPCNPRAPVEGSPWSAQAPAPQASDQLLPRTVPSREGSIEQSLSPA